MNLLWEKGVLLQIQSSAWSMEALLNAVDLDKNDNDIPNFVRLGSKRLFPKERRNSFNRLIQRMRSNANRFGFNFFLNGAYFVPNQALEELLILCEKTELEFYVEVESFLESYETEKIAFLNEYPEHRANLAPFYPDVDEVRTKFSLNIWCYQISSAAIPMGEFGSITDDAYVEWATSAVNSLRAEAVEVAQYIGDAVTNDSLDGRNLRKVASLIERLSVLDLMEDTTLLQAARQLASNPTVNAVNTLKKAATPIPAINLRRLILD